MKFIILFTFLTSSVACFAQTQLEFQFDTNGNVTRKVKKNSGILREESQTVYQMWRRQTTNEGEVCSTDSFIDTGIEKIASRVTGEKCLNVGDSSMGLKILRDRDICSCLDNEKPLYYETTKIKEIENFIDPQKYFEDQIKSVWENYEGQRIAEVVSSSIMFDERPDLSKYFIKEDGELKKIIEEQIKESQGEKLKKDGVAEKILVSKMKDALVEKLPEGSCISTQEYLRYRQFPHSEALVQSFKSSYKKEDWDFETLRNNYKDLGAKVGKAGKLALETDKKELALLLDKLKYLNRNPMLKHFFSEKNSKPKEELFKVLANYKGQPPAVFDPDYDKELKKFFSQGNNAEVVKDISDSVWKKSVKVLKDNKPKLTVDGRMVLTHEEVEEGIRFNYGFNYSVDANCFSSFQKDLIKCMESYKVLCSTINDPKLIVFSDTREKWDIDEILREDMDPDVANSEGYKKANNALCMASTEDGKEVSFTSFKASSCANMSSLECRQEFIQKHKTNLKPAFLNLADYFQKNPFKKMDSTTINEIANSKPIKSGKGMRENFDSYRSEFLFDRTGELASFAAQPNGTEASSLNNNGAVASGSNDFYQTAPVVSGYQGNSGSEKNSIDDYSPEEQEGLLESWRKEMEALNDTPVSGPEGERQKLASQKALQERIAALETLLLQQKELSDKQYALLNDALKSKEKELENKIAELESTEKKAQKAKRTQVTGQELEEAQSFRSPASVMKAPTAGHQSGAGAGDTAGARAGAGAIASGQGSAQAMKEAANREALAREEAKLVNLRQEASGAIVLEGTKGGGANAIALAISDEFYKQARGNLASINLLQIEKNIPKEQIDLLEKHGVITLILQNGSNPPLEVKVTRKKGRLVQLDNSPAMVRKVSLQSLQNSFKN